MIMIIETLNNNVMLVELSKDEMKSLNITYEDLDKHSKVTQSALKSLLCKIDTKKRASNGTGVLVEALPTEDGGCFFIFTFKNKEFFRYRAKINKDYAVFKADNIDDFLDFMKTARPYCKKKTFCKAFKLKNKYYLYFPEKSNRLCQLMWEYGKKVDFITYEWLNEHCETLGKIYLQ